MTDISDAARKMEGGKTGETGEILWSYLNTTISLWKKCYADASKIKRFILGMSWEKIQNQVRAIAVFELRVVKKRNFRAESILMYWGAQNVKIESLGKILWIQHIKTTWNSHPLPQIFKGINCTTPHSHRDCSFTPMPPGATFLSPRNKFPVNAVFAGGKTILSVFVPYKRAKWGEK